MFYRTAIRHLREWAEKEERKPLVLRGARQVGKNTRRERGDDGKRRTGDKSKNRR